MIWISFVFFISGESVTICCIKRSNKCFYNCVFLICDPVLHSLSLSLRQSLSVSLSVCGCARVCVCVCMYRYDTRGLCPPGNKVLLHEVWEKIEKVRRPSIIVLVSHTHCPN